MTTPRGPLSEDELRRQLASAAALIDPQPPTREELDELRRQHSRRHRVWRTGAPLLAAAAVVAIALTATAMAVHHRSAPRPPATVGPTSTLTPTLTPSLPSTSPPPSSLPNSTPSATSTAPTTSQPYSPPPSASSQTLPAASPAGLPLVPGPYGFLVPQGWNVHPLVAGGGNTVHYGSVTRGVNADYATAAPYTIQYVSGWLSAGRGAGQPYTSDHRPDLALAAAGTLCPATSWQAISSNKISFTCRPVAGMTPRGVLIVEPYPQGTKQVAVTLPADQQATATSILDSFH